MVAAMQTLLSILLFVIGVVCALRLQDPDDEFGVEALEKEEVASLAEEHDTAHIDSKKDDVDKSKVACGDLQHVPKNVQVMFINLDSRTDRRKKFEASVPKVLEPFMRCLDWNVERFPAVTAAAKTKHDGQVAAARSHVAVLRKSVSEATKDMPLLIFEDDFRFDKDVKDVSSRLEKAFKAVNGTWDVMMLGDNSHHIGGLIEGAEITQTKGAWCSEAYLVAPEYKSVLLEEVEGGLKKMEAGQHYVHREVEPLGAAYDTLWYPLQHDSGSHWYTFRPKIGTQENTWGDSDINQ